MTSGGSGGASGGGRAAAEWWRVEETPGPTKNEEGYTTPRHRCRRPVIGEATGSSNAIARGAQSPWRPIGSGVLSGNGGNEGFGSAVESGATREVKKH